MKNTYKYIALQGYALSPTASGHNPATRTMTHFSEYSQGGARECILQSWKLKYML